MNFGTSTVCGSAAINMVMFRECKLCPGGAVLTDS